VLGILGEYVGRTFDEAKARPLYIVRETVGFPAEPEPDAEADEPAEEPEERDDFVVFT